jgi:hypothetical protein
VTGRHRRQQRPQARAAPATKPTRAARGRTHDGRYLGLRGRCRKRNEECDDGAGRQRRHQVLQRTARSTCAATASCSSAGSCATKARGTATSTAACVGRSARRGPAAVITSCSRSSRPATSGNNGGGRATSRGSCATRAVGRCSSGASSPRPRSPETSAGLFGADLKCRGAAAAAGLAEPERFHALLSTGDVDAKTRFKGRCVALPYVLVTGKKFADNFAALIEAGPLGEGIAVTETGAALYETYVRPTRPPAASASARISTARLDQRGRGLQGPCRRQRRRAGRLATEWPDWKGTQAWLGAASIQCNKGLFHLYCLEISEPAASTGASTGTSGSSGSGSEASTTTGELSTTSTGERGQHRRR